MSRKKNNLTVFCQGWFLFLAFSLLAFPVRSIAQKVAGEPDRVVSRAYLLGLGHVNLLDTYLSPLSYQGAQLSFLGERSHATRIAGGKVGFQSLFQAIGCYALSPVQNGTTMGGFLMSRTGLHYRWQPVAGLRLFAGGNLNFTGGGLYNLRNGNNPAQAKLQLDVAASLAASWSFRIGRQLLALRGQVDMLLAGLMFSPNYGQSYYELFSLGNYDHNVCFVYPGNAPTFRQMLTFDVPIHRATLRLGYVSEIEQSRVNGLKNHRYSHSFMIGFVRDLHFLSRKKIPANQIFY